MKFVNFAQHIIQIFNTQNYILFNQPWVYSKTDIQLKFRKFQSRYLYKIHSYEKRV